MSPAPHIKGLNFLSVSKINLLWLAFPEMEGKKKAFTIVPSIHFDHAYFPPNFPKNGYGWFKLFFLMILSKYSISILGLMQCCTVAEVRQSLSFKQGDWCYCNCVQCMNIINQSTVIIYGFSAKSSQSGWFIAKCFITNIGLFIQFNMCRTRAWDTDRGAPIE